MTAVGLAGLCRICEPPRRVELCALLEHVRIVHARPVVEPCPDVIELGPGDYIEEEC